MMSTFGLDMIGKVHLILLLFFSFGKKKKKIHSRGLGQINQFMARMESTKIKWTE